MRSIFNEVDPVGIYFDENNIDEYDPEIKTIIPALPELKNVDDFRAKVKDIFVSMFENVRIDQGSFKFTRPKAFRRIWH